MKICIVGAGAIGGFLGARLAHHGAADVSALARGETLLALRQHGWRLSMGSSMIQVPAKASDQAQDLGVQDAVFIAVKGPALTALAPNLKPLIGPNTMVIPAMNGVPWWFAQGMGHEQTVLQSVDPGGVMAAAVATRHIVGCVVHASAACPEPGWVAHRMGQGLILGEPAGGHSVRVQTCVDLLQAAGFEAVQSVRIRQDIWYKLWGNMTINPISAITGATADLILDDDLVREFCAQAMREAAQIGALWGCPLDQTPEDRNAITRKLGAFKTSMLQDVEAGRSIELDALVGAVRELAAKSGLTTPHIDALFGMTRLFARTRGLYPRADPQA